MAVRGEGGLMDLALHPKFSQNRWLYLAYTIEGDSGALQTRVSRFRLTDKGLTEKLDIFPSIPGTAGNTHFGSRLAFGQDGKLYITLGERGEPQRAHVKQGPDGFLYIATSDNDGYGDGRSGGDRIIRLVPNSSDRVKG